MSYKEHFPVKPFRQRYDEQDRSRKKSDQTHQDELIKIAGNLASFERLSENEAYLRLDFYKFICAESAKSDGKRSSGTLANFFFVTFFLDSLI